MVTRTRSQPPPNAATRCNTRNRADARRSLEEKKEENSRNSTTARRNCQSKLSGKRKRDLEVHGNESGRVGSKKRRSDMIAQKSAKSVINQTKNMMEKIRRNRAREDEDKDFEEDEADEELYEDDDQVYEDYDESESGFGQVASLKEKDIDLTDDGVVDDVLRPTKSTSLDVSRPDIILKKPSDLSSKSRINSNLLTRDEGIQSGYQKKIVTHNLGTIHIMKITNQHILKIIQDRHYLM